LKCSKCCAVALSSKTDALVPATGKSSIRKPFTTNKPPFVAVTFVVTIRALKTVIT
jgi:hypothetical protein